MSKARNKLTPAYESDINFKTGSNATNSIGSYGDQNMIIKPSDSSRKLIDYLGSSPLAKLNYSFGGGRALRIPQQPDDQTPTAAEECVITDTYRSNYHIGAACNLNGTLQLSHTSSSSQLASRHCSSDDMILPMVDAVCHGLKSSSSQSMEASKKVNDEKIFIKSLEGECLWSTALRLSSFHQAHL